MKISKSKISQQVQEAISRYKNLSLVWYGFEKVTGAAIDSPLGTQVWELFDLYLDGVSLSIGDDDQWLAWYIFDDNCGEKGLTIKHKCGMKRKIESVEDLVAVIYKQK